MSQTWESFQKEQPFAAKMLRNSFERNRLSHAYLFEGETGTGKRDAGYLLAASVFCEQGKAGPCGQCVNCRRIHSGNHPDVHVIEPDGQSIKKDQITALRSEFSKSGVESNRKLYMLIDAEKMSIAAANSLLKFLEEPYSGTIAILTTSQPQRMLPTILSRCQAISFKSIPSEVLTAKLVDAGVHAVKAPLLAAMTNNMQQALELNEEDWFAQARKTVLKLYEVMKQEPLYAMNVLQEEWHGIFKERPQLQTGLDMLLLLYKDVLYLQVGKEQNLVYPDVRAQLAQDALRTSAARLSDRMAAILEAKRKLQANMNPQLLMEQLVLNLQGGPSFV